MQASTKNSSINEWSSAKARHARARGRKDDQRLNGLPELRTLHTTNGKWDLVAEVRTTSLEAFDRVLREVRLVEGVANSETSLLLSSV